VHLVVKSWSEILASLTHKNKRLTVENNIELWNIVVGSYPKKSLNIRLNAWCTVKGKLERKMARNRKFYHHLPFSCHPLKERETAAPLRHYQNYLPYIYEWSTCNWCVSKAVMSKNKATFQGVVVFFSTGGEWWPGDGELLRWLLNLHRVRKHGRRHA